MRLQPPLALVSPPDTAAWDALAAEAEGATVFHTSAWGRLWVAAWPGARWEAVVLPDRKGYAGGLGVIIRPGVFGRSILAMPYATYGGPLVRPDHPDPTRAGRQLLEGYAALARGARVLASELTWYEGRPAELPAGFTTETTFTHVRALGPDFDSLRRALPHAVRKRLRQAEEHGLTVRQVADPEGVRAYHGLAVRTMRRRGGRAKPLSLYLRILELLVPAGLARYDLVYHRDMPISGSLHLVYRGGCINWLTVSDERHWRLRSNDCVIAAVLRDLCAAGFREYNLGGSPPGADGLVRFKESWGATRRTVLQLRHRSLVHHLLRVGHRSS